MRNSKSTVGVYRGSEVVGSSNQYGLSGTYSTTKEDEPDKVTIINIDNTNTNNNNNIP